MGDFFADFEIITPRMYPYETQMIEIRNLQKEIEYYREQNYEFILADESLFNPDKYNMKHWMKSNQSIMKVSKYSGVMPKINVCCVISANFGNIYNHYGEKYFTSQDMIEVLQTVRDRIGSGQKIVMFWDNASIHNSEEIRKFAQKEDIDIALCNNIRYRCDIQPVELIYRRAKFNYAKELDQCKVNNQPWDQKEMVKYVMEQLPDEFVKKQASKLFDLIGKAKPTVPLQTEETVKLGFVYDIELSPDRNYSENISSE